MTNQHARTSIATGACLTLGVAVAVAVGALPQVGGSGPLAPAVSVAAPQSAMAHFLTRHTASASHHAAAHVRHVTHVAPAVSGSNVAAPSVVPAMPSNLVTGLTVAPAVATSVPAETANIRHATPRHKKRHHHRKRHHKPAAPKLAPRTTPSAAAVSAAIAGLRNYVHTPFTPTSSQVAQFGDQVCTAFDHNESYASVKSEILQKVQKLPFTTVTAGAADYVVKTAVSLYCPAYKSRVS